MNKPTIVILKGGEYAEVRGEDENGVHTDAGVHAWSEVEGFRCWSKVHSRWVFIPVG